MIVRGLFCGEKRRETKLNEKKLKSNLVVWNLCLDNNL